MNQFRFSLGVVLLASFAQPSEAQEACMRLVERTAERPSLDGPGAFGELNNTLTLGCLTYTGYTEVGSIRVALLKDEKGRMYSVKTPDYVGENHGHVTNVTPEFVEIQQLVGDKEGGYVEATRYLLLKKRR